MLSEKTHQSLCLVFCGEHSSHLSSFHHRHSELGFHKLCNSGDFQVHSYHHCIPHPVWKITKKKSKTNVVFLEGVTIFRTFVHLSEPLHTSLCNPEYERKYECKNEGKTPHARLGLPQCDIGQNRFPHRADHRNASEFQMAHNDL